MKSLQLLCRGIAALLLVGFALPAGAQSFQVQCPNTTLLHPNGSTVDPAHPGLVKCQQISGGDGFLTMGDGTQEYLFAFGPLSGMADIVNYGLPGTQTASEFNKDNTTDPDFATRSPDGTQGAPYPGYAFNGAVGLAPDYSTEPWVADTPYGTGAIVRTTSGVILVATAGGTSGASEPTGAGADNTVTWAVESTSLLTGHVDPRLIMDVGTLNGSFPAPLFAIDEDDEFFLTLTNVGMIMRPDLFEQHTVHFHGYPNASAFYDGVPDASVAINIGASFTYYYLAPDAGTYLWHCHITPPEHLEMGMVGQVYVRPRQNRATGAQTLYENLVAQQDDDRTKCDNTEILCTNPLPAGGDNGMTHAAGVSYTYNDGDGSSAYNVDYPINLHGFDPNFHFVGMTFNPETFTDLKDKYFMLNGRSYPDTVNPDAIGTQGPDGVVRYSQPMRDIINIPAGGRALLRLSDLNVTEFHTLASLGIRMHVVGDNAKLLRDQDGNNMDYYTNSITIGGGESIDVILDACQQRAADGNCTTAGYAPGEVYYLYTPQLDHLSNDAENFGGMMTEVRICSAVNPTTKACTI